MKPLGMQLPNYIVCVRKLDLAKIAFSRDVPCWDCENCLPCSFYVKMSLLIVTPASEPSCFSSAWRPLSAGISNVQEAVFRDLFGTQAEIFKRGNLFLPERSLQKVAFSWAKRDALFELLLSI